MPPLNAGHPILGHPSPLREVGLPPAEAMSQRAQAATKTRVIH
jgi:hypothetical protein